MAWLQDRFVLIVLGLFCMINTSQAQAKPIFFAHCPNALRIETVEQVSLSIQNVPGAVKFQLYFQDYPNRKKTFSQKEVEVNQGSPQIVNVKVGTNDVAPPPKADKQYVYLVIKSVSAGFKFEKEARVLLSRKSRAVYMQTDKPIYTPTQTVRLRIIPVGIDLKPIPAGKLMVEIRNPDGKIVERYDRLFSRAGYIVQQMVLGDTPLIGNWTISALYEKQNTSITFEVREYVLPRFSVEVIGPKYVLQNDKEIKITVRAKYVYGKSVKGRVQLKLGVINDRSETIHVDNTFDTLDKNGEAIFRISTSTIKQLKEDIWFPDDDRLNIVASVTERASGQVESSTDTSIHFSTTPYRITFKRSMLHFKPGLPFEAQVDIKYPSKRPTVKTMIRVSGTSFDDKNKPTDLTAYGDEGLEAITDENGRTKITVDVPADAVSITIKAKLAASEKIADKFNKEAIFKASPYQSSSKSYALVRSPEVMPQVGRVTEIEVFIISSKAVQEFHYMVISRGKILLSKVHAGPGAITAVRFKVTPEMCPVMRVVVYYTIENNGKTEVISDFALVDVKDEFKNKVTIETAKREERPGSNTIVTIRGTPHSHAAILAVDKSIYILRDAHKLTSEVVFRGLKRFDLGCGFGGGKNAEDVFKNSGITTITNANLKTETRKGYDCGSDVSSRKRRSVEGTKCCEDGKKGRTKAKSCKLQAESIGDDTCKKIFIRCCKGESKFVGRSFALEEEEDEIFEDDRKVQFRSNFPETWLFGDVEIGASGVATKSFKVPDTITTWVMQAFATSTVTGLGVATPYSMTAFKNFFVQLNLPYSIIRNEQVMLSASVFNFGNSRSLTRVYMKGEEGLCYDAREKRRSAPQMLRVAANDAVTFKFPMIPLELGEKNVTVIAYTASGGDAVTRQILIEPEGIEQVKTLSEFIDPSSIAGSKTQEITLDTSLPVDAIPGSESATFFISGDLLGPIVTKLLSSVQKALRNPTEVYQVSSTETYTVTVPQTYSYTYTETYTQYYRVTTPSCTCNINNGGCLRSRSSQRQKVATGTRQVQRTRTRTVWKKRERFVVKSMAPNVYVLQYLKRTNQLTDAIKKQAEHFITESYRHLVAHRTKDGAFNMWGNTEAGTLWLTAFVANNLQDARKFVTIDPSVICDAINYLLSVQKESGAFLEEGQSFAKGMMGGTNGDPAMTAFVLISVFNVECFKMSMKIYTATEKAQKYLEQKLPTMKRVYDVAITTYSLALANSQQATNALAKLEKMASQDKEKGTVFWKEDSESLSVEATSYALLALLYKKKLSYSKSIIKWLTQHRNAEGGFSSGQDTVMGLKALSAYASIQPELNLQVTIKSTADSSFRKRFHINKRTALVQESIEVPTGGKITVKATGVGTAEAQVELHYNFPRPIKETCPFTTKIKVEEITKDEEYSYKMKICTRYTGKGDVGMSVMEIGILTGFVPIQEAFEKMLAESKIKRYELSDRAMVVYFEKIKKDSDTCVSVLFKRAFDVGLVQPAAVVVKDFLEPSISCTTMYSLSGSSPVLKKICKGSQCKCTQERCSSCRPTRMRASFCKKDFVGLFKIKSSRKEGTWKVYTANIVKLYRGSHVFEKKQTDLWVNSRCNCPKFQLKRVFLIMGMRSERIVLDDQSFIRKFPRRKRDKEEYKKVDGVLDGLKARRC
eukprot:gene6960-7745_t